MKSLQRKQIRDRRWILSGGIVLFLVLLALSACAPAPTATPQPTATPTAIDTPSPTPSPFPTSTATATNTPRPTLSPPPTATPTRQAEVFQVSPGMKFITTDGSSVDANSNGIYEVVKIKGQPAVVGKFLALRNASGIPYFVPLNIMGSNNHQLTPDELINMGFDLPWMN